MGYLRSITLTSARIKDSGRRIVSARLLGRGAARTSNGVRMSAVGQPGAYATKEGDFVECGVNRGGLSRAVIHYVDFERLNKQFWLLDTYEGLVDRLISEDERRRGILPGGYEPCYENVVETFRRFRGVQIVRGVVPDTLSQVTATAICYLSLDMNNTAPEIAAAERFWDRLVPGGIIVLDDYGWRKQVNQKIAFDRFAEARKVNVLSLPTGQGLLIKP